MIDRVPSVSCRRNPETPRARCDFARAKGEDKGNDESTDRHVHVVERTSMRDDFNSRQRISLGCDLQSAFQSLVLHLSRLRVRARCVYTCALGAYVSRLLLWYVYNSDLIVIIADNIMIIVIIIMALN